MRGKRTTIACAALAGTCLVAALAARADEVPPVNPYSGNVKEIKEGRAWFMNVCSVCHGGDAGGGGNSGAAADLRVFNKGFRVFVYTVKNGRDNGRTIKMPAWGPVLDDKTIYQIGAFLETLALPSANWKDGVQQN